MINFIFIFPNLAIIASISPRLGAEQPPAALTKFATMNLLFLFVSAIALTYVYLSILTLVVKLAFPDFFVNLNFETKGEGFSSTINVKFLIYSSPSWSILNDIVIGTIAASSAL